MLRTAFQKVGAYSVLSGRAGYKGGVFVVGRRQLNSEAIAALSQEEWKAKWTEAVKDIRADLGYQDSSLQLRKLIKTGLLRFTDLRDNPERFFEAHRILALHSPMLGPGFWIRFTVQYNLFAGSILGLASDKQLKALEDFQTNGTLGCFGLTEKLAGVNSGLVINTTAEWNNDKGVFILNSPNLGSDKNWISQGYVADKALVFADLTVNGVSRGGQAFVMDFRRDGYLVKGITITDMGRKTVGNDLDNAAIHFDNVELDKSALLNRFGDITEDGMDYKLVDSRILPMQMIGQRLFTGRVAVAQAALTYTRELFKMTKEYSDNKQCWSPSGQVVLTDIPQLKDIYEKFERSDANLTAFVNKCESELNNCLKANKVPSLELIEAIACAKVRCVETSIEFAFKLKQEVGSYALMSGTGFEQMDFIQCCKFAEGDSRILMQKMARDRFRLFSKKQQEVNDRETELCAIIAKAIQDNGGNVGKGWDASWATTYELADATMDRTFSKFML